MVVGGCSINVCDWQIYPETQDSKPRELDVVKSVVDKTCADMIGATGTSAQNVENRNETYVASFRRRLLCSAFMPSSGAHLCTQSHVFD